MVYSGWNSMHERFWLRRLRCRCTMIGGGAITIRREWDVRIGRGRMVWEVHIKIIVVTIVIVIIVINQFWHLWSYWLMVFILR